MTTMAERSSSIVLLTLLCLSAFLSATRATHTAAVNNGAVKHANEEMKPGKDVDCFFGSQPPHFPFTLPPLPSGGFHWPPQFPFTLPPLPAGGFKPPQWPPQFPFTLPPLPAGGFKPPQWPPQFPFTLPPLPAGGFKPPHWPPLTLPPMPAGGFHMPPNWPFPGPFWPPHGHAGAQGADRHYVHA